MYNHLRWLEGGDSRAGGRAACSQGMSSFAIQNTLRIQLAHISCSKSTCARAVRAKLLQCSCLAALGSLSTSGGKYALAAGRGCHLFAPLLSKCSMFCLDAHKMRSLQIFGQT